ncbi:MAG: extradiol dioxygenase [Proteobacteria bacterium]|nr:extradiol dioxygenase [Pseudomonadota bacterium]
MIVGAHVMIQSSNDAADKKFFSDVLKLSSIDAGGGFMLYGIPPTEIAIHGGTNGKHEVLLMCKNAEAFVADMKKRGLSTTPLQNQGWGIVTQVSLPGGGTLGVYQPLYTRPKAVGVKAPAKKVARAKKPAKKSAKKKAKAKPRRGKARRR